MRLTLRWLWIVVTGLAALPAGTATVTLGTEAGRGALVRFGLAAANDALNGRVTIGSVGGSLVGGLEVTDLRVTEPDGAPFVHISTLRLRYRLRDFLSGRIVLGQLRLADADVSLVEGPDGRFNYHRVLRLGEGDGTGTDPLVAFNDVVLDDVRITVGARAGGTDGGAERRIIMPAARLPYLRLASPFPGESGILIRLAGLEATVSDPALEFRDVQGDVTIRGDSVHLALNRVQLPDTRGAVRGVLVPADGGLLMDVHADLSPLRSDDLQGLVDLFPDGFTGRVQVHVATPARDVLAFTASDMDLRPPDGGRIAGRLGMVLGPGERWEVREADVQTTDFAVHHLEVLMDSIPFRGTLTGRTRARGPQGTVNAEVDWRYRDARAEGMPETELAGQGVVGIGVPGDLVFRAFALERARVALATVRVLVPAVELQGTLDAVGTLDGAWQNAEFSGSLRHVHDTLAATLARGVVRLDGRGDTVGVWADLAFDSLELEGVRPSYPDLPLSGAFAGDVRLAGYFDALAFETDLVGPTGALRGVGTLVVLPERLGVRDLDLTVRELAAPSIEELLPDTRLNAHAAGTAVVDSGASPVIDLDVALARSVVGGLVVDSARGRMRSGDGLLRVDTLVMWAHGTHVHGAGGLGLRWPRRDSLVLAVDVDSVAAFLPVIERLLDADSGALADSVGGRLSGTLAMQGALDTFALVARVDGYALRWDALEVPTARLDARWAGEVGRADVALTIDSVASGRLGFAALEARFAGQPDSLAWFARGRIGQDAAALGGGTFRTDSLARTVGFDSLAVLLGTNVWFLTAGASLELRDTAVTLHDMRLEPRGGGARVALEGVLPLRGPGNLRGNIERFPLRDLWAIVQFDPQEAGGELSGTLELTGTARAPVIDASLALADGALGEFRAPLIEIVLAYRDRRLEGTGGLWRLGQQVLRLEIGLPLDLALRGAPERRLPGGISIRARADGVDLAILEALYPGVRRTAGHLFADFGIGGTWERPELTGEITVREGAASFRALGVRYERLDGRITFAGDTIQVRRLTATTGDGQAELSGFIRLEGLTSPRLGLSLEARDFRVIAVQDVLALTVSGNARLQGPVFGATLSGRATIPRGVLWFADIVEKSVIDLDEALLAEEERELIRRQGLGQEFTARFLDSLRVDGLSVEMGNEVWLRSSEANIGLTGAVLVNKTGEQ